MTEFEERFCEIEAAVRRQQLHLSCIEVLVLMVVVEAAAEPRIRRTLEDLLHQALRGRQHEGANEKAINDAMPEAYGIMLRLLREVSNRLDQPLLPNELPK